MAPLALLLSLRALGHPGTVGWRRIAAIASTVAAAICVALMFYRGYWTSLGW